MSRFLLFVSIAGLAVAAWSFLASAAIRPAPFDLLIDDISSTAHRHNFLPEEKELLLLRVSELQSAHSAEIQRYSTALSISLFGLLGVSALSLLIYAFSRHKVA